MSKIFDYIFLHISCIIKQKMSQTQKEKVSLIKPY